MTVEEGVFRVELNLDQISRGTLSSEDRIKFFQRVAAHLELDTQKETRRKCHECKACYYTNRSIAGQAFSDRPCRNIQCRTRSRHPNTDVPAFCEDCAKTYGICRRCGGDLELAERRSMNPPKRR